MNVKRRKMGDFFKGPKETSRDEKYNFWGKKS